MRTTSQDIRFKVAPLQSSTVYALLQLLKTACIRRKTPGGTENASPHPANSTLYNQTQYIAPKQPKNKSEGIHLMLTPAGRQSDSVLPANPI